MCPKQLLTKSDKNLTLKNPRDKSIIKTMNEKSKQVKVRKAGGAFIVRSAAGQIISQSNSQAMTIARDPKQAEAFLKKAGLIVEAGKLAPEYAA